MYLSYVLLIMRGYIVDPYCNHRMRFPVLRPVYLCLHAVTTTPAVTDGICPLVLSHRYQPSPSVERVGSCIGCFGACSVFTAHYGLQTRQVA
jgi:hypothetical protein